MIAGESGIKYSYQTPDHTKKISGSNNTSHIKHLVHKLAKKKHTFTASEEVNSAAIFLMKNILVKCDRN